jgi:hypothetical protein
MSEMNYKNVKNLTFATEKQIRIVSHAAFVMELNFNMLLCTVVLG